jgi:Zn-dependent metalloprotease
MTVTQKTLALAIGLAFAGAATAAGNRPEVDRALGILKAHPSAGHTAAADRFSVRDVIVDADGSEHVRFERSHAGLPMIGGDLVVHSRNGQLLDTSLTLSTRARPGLQPRISAEQAIVEAGADFAVDFRGMPTARLVVYARDAKPVLAWEVRLNGIKADQTPTEMRYFVDARTGKILDAWDEVHTANAVGTGNTLTLGQVTLNTNSIAGGYELRDNTRGGGTTLDNNNASTSSTTGVIFTDADNTWGNFNTSDRASAAADAHFGVAMTWDYFKTIHLRNGINNNGVGAKSLVHVGTNWVNASWSNTCFCMRYGDGDGVTYRPLTALDVAGHEMSHGVTAATSGLAYSRDAGGLNEGTSDIFGTMVEFHVNNASDAPDYLIGEKIYISNPNGTKALRVMFKQDLDGKSFSCYPSNGFRRQDPHYTSGVANRFFYLLAQGAVVPAGFGAGTSFNLTPASLVCNGDTGIVGIGRAKAQAIWYRALDLYFTSSTTYPNARTHTLKAAADLYGGTGSPEYAAVARAWTAVKVN